jgi:hypothetical protein
MTTMTTYCLITKRSDTLAGFQPVLGERAEDVINFTFGLLTERTKSDPTLFAALGVEWVLEEGLRDLNDLDTPAGREIGRWKMVGSLADPDLKWFGTK